MKPMMTANSEGKVAPRYQQSTHPKTVGNYIIVLDPYWWVFQAVCQGLSVFFSITAGRSAGSALTNASAPIGQPSNVGNKQRALALDEQGALVASGVRKYLETKHPQDRYEGTPEDILSLIHI